MNNEYMGSIKARLQEGEPVDEGDSLGIDFDSDEPLVCKIDGSKPIEGCESCQ